MHTLAHHPPPAAARRLGAAALGDESMELSSEFGNSRADLSAELMVGGAFGGAGGPAAGGLSQSRLSASGPGGGGGTRSAGGMSGMSADASSLHFSEYDDDDLPGMEVRWRAAGPASSLPLEAGRWRVTSV